MLTNLLKKRKDLRLERRYDAPIDRVWLAWTDPDQLRQWWGPEKTTIPECALDLRIGGTISIVMEATEAMGKYAGTRWPMEGTFTEIDAPTRLRYDARSWTDGDDRDTTVIAHTNDVALRADGDATTVVLTVAITEIGPKAKMAAFGMKWGYKAQLDKLEALLSTTD